MKKLYITQILTSSLLLASTIIHSATLINPWTENPIKYQKKSMFSSCPTVPILQSNLTLNTGIYSDKIGSIKDPNKIKLLDEKTLSYRGVAQNLVNLSNNYIKTGNQEVSACAVNILLNLAQQNALAGTISGYQAQFTQTWLLSSFSLVWLKIKTSQNVTDNQKKIINQWLTRMADNTKNYFSPLIAKNPQATNNMGYWAGLAVMATGVATNDKDYFNWSMNVLKIGINSIDNNGFLPNELKRGSKSLHYHLFSLQPLITMAELAQKNNIDVYSYNNNGLSRLIHQTLSSMINPTKINSITHSIQDDMTVEHPYLGFLLPYYNRTQDPLIKLMLNNYKSRSYLYLGGSPLP